MPSIDDIAAEYMERAAALDPLYATYTGIAGHDHELPDLGADGFADALTAARSRSGGNLNSFNNYQRPIRTGVPIDRILEHLGCGPGPERSGVRRAGPR